MSIKPILFDIDGTLADSNDQHVLVSDEVFGGEGATVAHGVDVEPRLAMRSVAASVGHAVKLAPPPPVFRDDPGMGSVAIRAMAGTTGNTPRCAREQ